MTTKVATEMIAGFADAVQGIVDDAIAESAGVVSVNGRSGAVTGLAEVGRVISGIHVTGRDRDQLILLALKDTARDLKSAGMRIWKRSASWLGNF